MMMQCGGTDMMVAGALAALVGLVPLVSLMVLAQTANGVLLPAILIYTVRLSSNRGLMGDRANGPIYQAFTWICTVGLIGLAFYLVIQPLVS